MVVERLTDQLPSFPPTTLRGWLWLAIGVLLVAGLIRRIDPVLDALATGVRVGGQVVATIMALPPWGQALVVGGPAVAWVYRHWLLGIDVRAGLDRGLSLGGRAAALGRRAVGVAASLGRRVDGMLVRGGRALGGLLRRVGARLPGVGRAAGRAATRAGGGLAWLTPDWASQWALYLVKLSLAGVVGYLAGFHVGPAVVSAI